MAIYRTSSSGYQYCCPEVFGGPMDGCDMFGIGKPLAPFGLPPLRIWMAEVGSWITHPMPEHIHCYNYNGTDYIYDPDPSPKHQLESELMSRYLPKRKQP